LENGAAVLFSEQTNRLNSSRAHTVRWGDAVIGSVKNLDQGQKSESAGSHSSTTERLSNWGC